MTVISGYLGAGKTTLINRLLAADHGLKLMVLVNDFGAINIDARLLASRDEDTIALTNGCVCCTMGADLFMALGDALDRRPRPDHLIVEASGVSDPARIANAALAEPEMRYGGIVTVVDGLAFDGLQADPLIGPQLVDQVAKADVIAVSKIPEEAALPRLATDAATLRSNDVDTLARLLLLQPVATATPASGAPHPTHTAWSCSDVTGVDVATLRAALAARPAGLFRLKGRVIDRSGAAWDVQVVGQQIEVTPAQADCAPALVGIGLSDRLSLTDVDAWWASLSAG